MCVCVHAAPTHACAHKHPRVQRSEMCPGVLVSIIFWKIIVTIKFKIMQ